MCKVYSSTTLIILRGGIFGISGDARESQEARKETRQYIHARKIVEIVMLNSNIVLVFNSKYKLTNENKQCIKSSIHSFSQNLLNTCTFAGVCGFLFNKYPLNNQISSVAYKYKIVDEITI
jgi:hypothetical protein